jgi:hypothetical protein
MKIRQTLLEILDLQSSSIREDRESLIGRAELTLSAQPIYPWSKVLDEVEVHSLGFLLDQISAQSQRDPDRT